MKSIELSVGNIVSIGGVPQRIRSVTRRKVGYCKLTNPNLSYARLHEVEPIPITEEILAKNGFSVHHEQYADRLVYKIENGYCHRLINYISRSNESVWSYEIVDHEIKATKVAAEIQYIHQMQNMLNVVNLMMEVKV